MLDFTPVRNKEKSLSELAAHLTVDSLGRLAHGMIDKVLELTAGCSDGDVVFEPQDPEANDPYAANKEDVQLPWTLGHVIVHLTASMEESAFLAAELARGVEFHGRSRYEVPWQAVKTMQQCRHRLEECRRICHASLGTWPETPHLGNRHIPWEGMPPLDAKAYFLIGLFHADSHLGQIAEIVHQSKAARQT